MHQESLSGYLSVLNLAMEDLLFPPVFERNARGHFSDPDVRRTLLGLQKAQGKRLRNDGDNDRLYLPADIALRFLQSALGRLRDWAAVGAFKSLDRDVVESCRDDVALAFS